MPLKATTVDNGQQFVSGKRMACTMFERLVWGDGERASRRYLTIAVAINLIVRRSFAILDTGGAGRS